MRPGFTTATQYSGAPLPLPMRVSAGFLVTGLSGNMRIQILPPRLMCLVMAIRAASICRSVIQAGSMHLSPYSPKLISPPRCAMPVMRPRICFRCLTFFGINIAFIQFRFPLGNRLSWSWVFDLCQKPETQNQRPKYLLFSAAARFTFASRAWPALALASACLIDRIRAGAPRHGRAGVHDLTAIDPDLDSDNAECR